MKRFIFDKLRAKEENYTEFSNIRQSLVKSDGLPEVNIIIKLF